MSRTTISITAVIFLLVALASAQSPPSPCAAPAYHQLDFWLGDWDTYDYNTAVVPPNARVHVTSILSGCVLHEDYVGADGHRGESFTIYDSTRKIWHQTWVTNRGELLTIEGAFSSGALTLTGTDHTSTGAPRQVRGTWKPISGGVRETAVRSLDGGKTWQPWFDLVFRPHVH